MEDELNVCHPSYWISFKAERVNRPVYRSKEMAFANVFDLVYVMKHNLKLTTKSNYPLTMLTDTVSLFDIWIRVSSITERKLNIDLLKLKDCYKNSEARSIA